MVPTAATVHAGKFSRSLSLFLAALLSLAVLTGINAATAPAAQAWDDPVAPEQYEIAMARLINQSRAAEGLAPLTLTVQMSDVARNWSVTMGNAATNNDPWAGFDHNPNYSNQIPAGWHRAGENIAGGTAGWFTAAAMHEGLMNSPGHRANIMNPDFTHIGIGVAHIKGMTYGTEVFAAYRNPANAGTVRATLAKHPSTKPITQIVPSADMNSDGYGDLLSVDGNGALWIHNGYQDGFVTAGSRIVSSGWENLTVYAPGDFNRDGKADILAKNTAGELYFYAGRGDGSFGSSKRVGWGWGDLEIIPAGDVSGDGTPDVLAINPAGELFYYAGDGRGGFTGRLTRNGQGWNGFDLYPAGDINGDGLADILSIDRSGRLFTHLGKGGGFFSKSYQSGQGWAGFELFAGADVNRDGYADLYSRDRSGELYFYAGRSGGGFRAKLHVGTDWN